MSTLQVRVATLDDCVELAENLRPADRQEAQALYGDHIAEALIQAQQQSPLCLAIWAQQQLIALAGLTCPTFLSNQAAPWLLATPAIEQHWLAITRLVKRVLPHFLKLYPQLANVVHAEHTQSQRWLRRLGFNIDSAVAFLGPGKPAFYRFSYGL